MLYYLENLISAIDVEKLRAALLQLLAVVVCLTVHETSHGLAALALGDPTARRQHRISLNPLRHIDWLGLAMLFAVGIGWAKPVSVDPRSFKHPKAGMALTALAGPASNFLLALLSIGASKVISLYIPATGTTAAVFEFLAVDLPVLSVGLGLFNLVPIPPLDGSKVLAAALPDEAYGVLMRYERYGVLLLLALSWLGVSGHLLGNAVEGTYLRFLKLFFSEVY